MNSPRARLRKSKNWCTSTPPGPQNSSTRFFSLQGLGGGTTDYILHATAFVNVELPVQTWIAPLALYCSDGASVMPGEKAGVVPAIQVPAIRGNTTIRERGIRLALAFPFGRETYSLVAAVPWTERQWLFFEAWQDEKYGSDDADFHDWLAENGDCR